jgi:hypothetical protein
MCSTAMERIVINISTNCDKNDNRKTYAQMLDYVPPGKRQEESTSKRRKAELMQNLYR